MIRYARAPSAAFAGLLSRGGILSPLLAHRVVAGLPLDLHLRERDHIHAYCGLTRLIDASFSGGRILVTAHTTYTSQSCAGGLFRPWSCDEGGFVDAVHGYLEGVAVRPALVQHEGAVQAAWAAVRSPWVPFDREAVLGYTDSAAQATGRAFLEIAAARAELERVRTAGRWATLPVGKVGAELDQLAVDPAGRLVLIELKNAAAKPESVYYSPLQLLQYLHEWAIALDVVREQLHEFMAARIALGMSPPDMPRLSGGLRPVVAFGADLRNAEVRSRFEVVRAIANGHLPAGVSPIEVWAMEGGRPVRLD
ncbi:MAG: hypothetical protein IV100_23445 [Myxococcales bacterium]|nr:hypothetical protein [Myxococcales bacterium]